MITEQKVKVKKPVRKRTKTKVVRKSLAKTETIKIITNDKIKFPSIAENVTITRSLVIPVSDKYKLTGTNIALDGVQYFDGDIVNLSPEYYEQISNIHKHLEKI